MNKHRKQTPESYGLWGQGHIMTSSQMVLLESYKVMANVILRNILESTAGNLQTAGNPSPGMRPSVSSSNLYPREKC